MEKLHQQSRISMLENNMQALMKVIEPKISHIKVEEINLEDNKKELNQDLLRKIRFLNQRQSKMLFEIQNQQDFCALLYKLFSKQTSKRSSGIQTNIFDIQKPLLTGFEDYQQVEKFLQKKMGIINTKEKNTETEISMDQID